MSQLADQYREYYQSGSSLAEFLRSNPSSSAEEKVAILLTDQFLCWQASAPRAVSAYSEWIAEHALPPSIWLSLVTEEFGYREEQGGELDLQRFLEDCSQLPVEAKEFAHQLAEEHEPSVSTPEGEAGALSFDQEAGTRSAPKKVGRYDIQRQLGKGQFGQVFLANDPELDRQVAIKLPSTDAVIRAGGDESVIREARMVAALAHPGIVPVFDVGRTTLGELYIVSQYIPGGDLSRRQSPQPMMQHAAATLIAKIARALHAAHNCGLVHRDVKPANIVIDEDGEPKLVDFGLAIRDEEPQCTDLAGSPAYMSPEQARGEGHRVDARSDIYSLGAILYELLAGTRAHPGDTVESVLESVKIGEVRPPRQRNDKIHRELDRICRCALAARTFDRYSTALDLAEDLEAFLEQVPLSPEKKSHHEALISQVDLPQDTAETQQKVAATIQSSRTSDSIQSPPIVPKGLRAFDASDADFFLQLIPGARDRNGLPATVRQWKQRLEELPDEGEHLNIGLLYGPSGCGKSSLVRAGILPQLDSRIVAVTVNAKSHGTADSVLSALKTRIPGLNADSLRHAVSEIRKDSTCPPVVLVIDQFEQWLQHWQGEPDNELIQALRQCDGKQVRVLLLLRDDFWLAVTRLMRELDVQIVEGANATSIDAFSEHHARKVLTACGQAYGVVASEPSEENRHFIRRAVSELSDQGKVFPVYLALFLQMMQAKPWRSQTLDELGGIEGVGVKFLQETFGKLAPARYRVHAEAAQRVLGALTPADSLIRGKPKSASELCQAADFAGREEDFQEVLRFLDRELRLLTVVEATARAADAHEEHYQLTHDYLVPCIAQWLDQLRKTSWRGRSELELEQRADMWQRRPEWRSLPGFLAFLSIHITTQRRRWSDGQRQMMRVATRTYSTLVIVLLLITASSLWIGRELYGRTQAARIHSQLLVAELNEIPELSPQAETWQTWVNPLVLRSLSSAELTPRAHRNLAFVSLGMTLGNRDSFLSTTVEAALASPANELSIFSTRFRSLNGRVRNQLRAKLAEHLSDSTPSVRLRAASILLELNTSEAIDLCREHHEQLASDLVSTPQNLTSFISRFSPIFVELQTRFRLAWNSPDPRTRELAALALVQSFEGTPAELLVLVESADDAQLRTIKKLILENASRLRPLLQTSLTRPRFPAWPTEHAVLPAIAPEILTNREQASGWADPNFALCQWLPLEQVPAVVNELKRHGYRLIRLRPFETDDGFRSSAVWLRDGKKWDWRIGLTAEELKVAIDQQQELLPQDVAGYLSAISLDPNVPSQDVPRFAFVWSEPEFDGEQREVFYGLPTKTSAPRQKELRNAGYRELTRHLYTDRARKFLQHSMIWGLDAEHIEGSTYDVLTEKSIDPFNQSFDGPMDLTVVRVEDERCDVFYGGIWLTGDRKFDRRSAVLVSIEENKEIMRKWASQGFRPASIAAAQIPGGATKAGSAWIRPKATTEKSLDYAKATSNCASALAQLGDLDALRQILRGNSDNQLRCMTIENLAMHGVDPDLLLQLLASSQDTSVQAGVLLALGNYADLPSSTKAQLAPLLKQFQNSPEASLRAAVVWCNQQLRILEPESIAGELNNLDAGTPVPDERGPSWWRSCNSHLMLVVETREAEKPFTMGCLLSEPGSTWDERRHTKWIRRRFALCDKETTIEQFQRFLDANPETPFIFNGKEHPQAPVTRISWLLAAQYCNWLSQEAGLPETEWCYEITEDPTLGTQFRLTEGYLSRSGFRLPTEAEWEYCCRNGTMTARPSGNSESLLSDYAWFEQNSQNGLQPVGRKKPNRWGFFDMLGNAREWCQEQWTGDLTRMKTIHNGDHEDKLDVSMDATRVTKGGAFDELAVKLRSANRIGVHPNIRSESIGFRVARTLAVESQEVESTLEKPAN